ncbi:uncharacterized protein OCT59_004508 [Rhizophagus irregularis]|uniref:uncharacterized protein n=1 Tax=Rhizophagus irregularis TaxID=588596 RepID=UPI00332C3EC0|nr:hypothetical protein OCT59_004508 [Rhizophagus irregularis]
MDEIKLSDDVINQIKKFYHRSLTKEQELLIDKLITDKESKERYKKYAKGGFGTTFKAVWKEGPISNWNFDNNQWERHGGVKEVALKCLHNSQGITAEFLKEVESNSLVYDSGYTVPCFGITKDPKTNDFMMSSSSSSTAQLPLSSTSTLSYIAHTQAVYISKLLDFKNLPEPKNADNDNLEYSDSVRIDFTKLNITSNSKDE